MFNTSSTEARLVSSKTTVAYSSGDLTDDGNGSTRTFNIWEHYLKPKPIEWFVMVLYLLVFVVSLTGNLLIVIFVLRRKHLHTIVNYFMLNLALADIMVTVICLPPTLMIDFLETWVLGSTLCTLTPYLQMTAVSVSSLSLGAIAINRWFVVCHPLKVTRIEKSTRTAVITMVIIWAFGLATLSPIAFVVELHQDFDPHVYPDFEILKSCTEIWPSRASQAAFHTYFVVAFYVIPLLVLSITYTRVFRELHNAQIPGYSAKVYFGSGRRKVCSCSHSNVKRSTSATTTEGNDKGLLTTSHSKTVSRSSSDECGNGSFMLQNIQIKNGQVSKKEEEVLQENLANKRSRISRLRKSFSWKRWKKSTSNSACRKCSAQASLIRSRHRSAMMQVALIVVFGICYAPSMIMDLLRMVFDSFTNVHRETIHFVFAIAHLMVYMNSALNPIIYNFFSAQFRKEFRKTFRCLYPSARNRRKSTTSKSSAYREYSSKRTAVTTWRKKSFEDFTL